MNQLSLEFGDVTVLYLPERDAQRVIFKGHDPIDVDKLHLMQSDCCDVIVIARRMLAKRLSEAADVEAVVDTYSHNPNYGAFS